MKLRNKKTGEIIENAYVRESHDFYNKRTIAVFIRDGQRPPERVSTGYNSLAELNVEWEDAPEEPKTHWMIDTSVLEPVREIAGQPYEIDKEIGNWFANREEAEKAVEKLKAWKRLKDKGFVFKGINEHDGTIKTGLLKEVSIADCEEFYSDVFLLFGGKG